jgi:hypothetical protein
MTYQKPELTLIGAAQGLVLGSKTVPATRDNVTPTIGLSRTDSLL